MKRKCQILGIVLVAICALTFWVFKRVHRPAHQATLEQVEAATRRFYGASAIKLTQHDKLKTFIDHQPVATDASEAHLTSVQKTKLTQVIIAFLETYGNGDFDSILHFHGKAPYHIETGISLTDTNFLNDLRIEHLPIPNENDPLGQLRTIWMLAQHRQFRVEFWARYLESLKRAGRKPPDDAHKGQVQEKLLPDYSKSLTKTPFPYKRLRFVGISTKHFALKAVRLRRPLPMKRLISENMKAFSGPQFFHRKMIVYNETPARIIARHRFCDFVMALMGVHTNGGPMIVPIVVAFYWSPSVEDWLMCAFVEHSAGGLGIVL